MISRDALAERAVWRDGLLTDEIKDILDVGCRRLFQISSPPVRFYLLADAMGRPLDDPQVLQAVSECRQLPQRLKLLETLQADGTWPISIQRRLAEAAGPGPPVGWTYITMLRNLFHLREYQVKASEGHVRAVLEKILSWQNKEGYILGPHTDLFPFPHYNGFALRGLLGFEMNDDLRVRKLVRWLLKMQRPDGGWLIPYIQDMKYMPQYNSMKMSKFMDQIRLGKVGEYERAAYANIPSCIWSTVGVIRGLSMSFELTRSEATMRGADFVLGKFFKRNYHPTFYRSESNWTRLKYPTYFGSGLLALDILTWCGFGAGDDRMDKPIRWLMSMRHSDGLWSQSDRPHPEKDQWITEISLSILSRYLKSLKGEPFGSEEELERVKAAKLNHPL